MPLVRWVGDPDPVIENRERVVALIEAGKLTKEDVWAYNQHREIVFPGVTFRELGPAEGLSEHYRWGPAFGTFEIEVTDADWDRIQRLPEAKRFALVER